MSSGVPLRWSGRGRVSVVRGRGWLDGTASASVTPQGGVIWHAVERSSASLAASTTQAMETTFKMILLEEMEGENTTM